MLPSRTRLSLAFLLLCIALPRPGAAQNLPIATFLTVDVPAVAVSGTLTLDGAPPPDSASELATLQLDGIVGPQTTTPVGTSADPDWGPLFLVPGTYQPRYELNYSFGGVLPRNASAPVGPPIEVDGLSDVDVDLPALNGVLELSLNGSALPTEYEERATIRLRNVESGVESWIGTTHDVPIAVSVLPGRYDVVYEYDRGAVLPLNTHAVIATDVDFALTPTVAIDIPAFSHAVSATLNGAAFPTSAYERGDLSLENPETGDRVPWGPTHVPVGVQRVIPGTYDVVYEHRAGSSIVPRNQRAVVATDLEIAPPPLPNMLSFSEIDLVAYETSVDATLDGATFPASAYEHGILVLLGERGDEVTLGYTSSDFDPVWVVAGGYDLHYRAVTGSSIVPWNEDALLRRRVRILGPSTLEVDVETVEITLDFRLDGAPFPASPYERGDFRLVGETPGDVIPLGCSCDQQVTLSVIPGTYDLFYDYVAGSSIVPHNVGQRAASDLAFLESATHAIDVYTRTVVPSFTVNGGPFPTLPDTYGEIVLRGPEGGHLSIGETNDPDPDPLIAMVGPYAIDYEWRSGIFVPRNPQARLGYTSVPEPGTTLALAIGALALTAGARRART
ncbi:MAG: PEP-CTERM sorting domain-containing protein [bacterium]|nr:PEP-CTERM sorting domain-containing protein [bacterium]